MTFAPTPPVIIANRYEVLRPLGKGSFGEVFEVRDHTLDTTCALKLLSDDVLFGPWNESQLLRGLRGEYILPVLNADVVAGRRYVVTEIMTGGTVEDHVSPGVGMPTDQAVRWTREACQGIARVHDLGLIHGDIKPGNLFLDHRSEVLVGDFGLAQRLDPDGRARAVGTKDTMAPEVALAGVPPVTTDLTYTVGGDVYSLGATLFWMLTGEPPMVGVSEYALLSTQPRPDVWERAPHIPRGLRDVVNKAIALDPADRPASAAELAAALGQCSAPARKWTRLVPHSGHEQCFRGIKGTSEIEVCAEPLAPNRLSIVACHAASRRKVRKAERLCSRSNLSNSLRSAFRACD